MRLELGESIRYQGLGAGQVVQHQERTFQGELRTFAVIALPHREMTLQLPIGDPVVTRRLSRVLSKTECRRLVTSLKEPGRPLPRNWDQRAESGKAVLKTGGPADWAELLRGYASARKEGMAVAASDAEIVRSAIEMLAAELCAATTKLSESELNETALGLLIAELQSTITRSYQECFEEVRSRYRKAAREEDETTDSSFEQPSETTSKRDNELAPILSLV
jgi:RNA polymerase-interacting CarD/CdnL/TRCF family regulator